MARYIVGRLVQSVVLLFLVVTSVFFIFQVMPGDITVMFIQPNVPPEVREAMITRLGLDRPMHDRYLSYMGGVVRGDLGAAFPTPSFEGGRPVLDIIGERLPRTALLFLVVVMTSYAIGFTLGKLIAWSRGTWAEYGGTVLGVVLLNVFTPVAALFFLWLFALHFGLFPFGGWQDFQIWRPFIARGISSNDVMVPMLVTGLLFIAWTLMTLGATRDIDRRRGRTVARIAGVGVYVLGAFLWWRRAGLGRLALDVVHHMGLPVLTLVTIGFAAPMLIMRDSMLETMREDFILTARAKGLEEKVVRDRHAARTALLPIATSFALALALVVDGAIITETIFSWPGMGHALLHSVVEQNFPVTMGSVLVLAVSVLLAHLFVDLLYALLDPRIRHA